MLTGFHHLGRKLVVLSGMPARIEAVLRRLALFLQCRMSRLSLRLQKGLLLSFCIAAAVAIILVTLYMPSATRPHVLKPASITIFPVPIAPKPTPLISKQEYNQIHALRLRLDSLHRVSDATIAPPIAGRRWTLRDTLLYLEQVYIQQFKR